MSAQGVLVMNRRSTAVKIIATIIGAVAFGIPAGAADLRSRPSMMAPAVYDWSGFYLGANFGGAFTREDVSTPIGTFSTDPSGVLGGFQAGYNFLFSPDWLFGIEAEFDLTSAQGTVNFTTPTTAFT